MDLCRNLQDGTLGVSAARGPSAGALMLRLLAGLALGGAAAFQVYGRLDVVLAGEAEATDLVLFVNGLALLVLVLRAIGGALRA